MNLAWGIMIGAIRSGKTISYATLVKLHIYYLVGSLVYHSAGCTWNDICDKDFDARVGMYPSAA